MYHIPLIIRTGEAHQVRLRDLYFRMKKELHECWICPPISNIKPFRAQRGRARGPFSRAPAAHEQWQVVNTWAILKRRWCYLWLKFVVTIKHRSNRMRNFVSSLCGFFILLWRVWTVTHLPLANSRVLAVFQDSLLCLGFSWSRTGNGEERCFNFRVALIAFINILREEGIFWEKRYRTNLILTNILMFPIIRKFLNSNMTGLQGKL